MCSLACACAWVFACIREHACVHMCVWGYEGADICHMESWLKCRTLPVCVSGPIQTFNMLSWHLHLSLKLAALTGGNWVKSNRQGSCIYLFIITELDYAASDDWIDYNTGTGRVEMGFSYLFLFQDLNKWGSGHFKVAASKYTINILILLDGYRLFHLKLVCFCCFVDSLL